MTLQPPIPTTVAQRKAHVRQYSRNAVLWAVGSLVVGLALGLILSWWLFLIAIIVGTVTVSINVGKVRKLVNHKDEWS